MSDNSSTSSPYDGFPVKQHEFRLLSFEEPVESNNSIKCKLRTCSIAMFAGGSLQFSAVSHRWSPEPQNRNILLNGIPFPVSNSLYELLELQMNNSPKESLWIDSICINQSDLAERSSQVQIMCIIYAMAYRLIIWLGPASDNSDQAIETLEDLGQGTVYEKMPVLDSQQLDALGNLLGRSYWKRVWIIQEAAFGGMGIKLKNIIIRCGSSKISWLKLVIALTRMAAHKDAQRQYFPNIDRALILETLRQEIGPYVVEPATKEELLEVVSKHRFCEATDARDKIYSLLGFMDKTGKAHRDIGPNYALSVSEVYTKFALYVSQNAKNLSFLKFCYPHGRKDLPSWIPDWSISGVPVPLPYRTAENRAPALPWWANPSYKQETVVYNIQEPLRDKNDRVIEKEHDRLRLAQESNDTYFINDIESIDELPGAIKQFVSKKPEMEDFVKRALKTRQLVIVGSSETRDHDEFPLDGVSIDQKEENLLKQSERATERRMKKNMLFEAENTIGGYDASHGRSVKTTFNQQSMLQVTGKFWDTIEVVHEKFDYNIDSSWEDSTRFLVSIGKCKQLAMNWERNPSVYHSTETKQEAFWLTLFAGRTTVAADRSSTTAGSISAGVKDIKCTMKFDSWLPPIKPSWRPTLPPLSVLETGRLISAESSALELEVILKHLDAALTSEDPRHSSGSFVVSSEGLRMTQELLPTDWHLEEKVRYGKRFQALADTWNEQPYDLYHRPFSLPWVVPDPYWETRRVEDNRIFKGKLTELNMAFADMPASLDKPAMQKEIDEKWGNTATRVPRETVPAGFEKFALGRRFFITKKGYFGLGPAEASVGDTIAILFGIDVPFVLRSDASGFYKVIGESYVHGIMKGEAMEEIDKDDVDGEAITLV